MHLGSEAVLETLELISKGEVTTTLQEDSSEIKTAYKLNKENCKIDWDKSGIQIYNLIRGLNPYPAAWTFFKDGANEWNVKLYDVVFEKENHNHLSGQILATKKELKIAVTDGYLYIKSLQFPGKRKMEASELLNGIQFSEKAMAF